MAMDKLFKGILQYSAEQFKSVTKEAGYIYLVRTDTTKTDGDAEIWFGTRRYGNVEASKIADFTERIESLDGRIDAIEEALGTWESQLGTVATVVKAHNDKLSGVTGTVMSEINSAVSGKADSSTVTALAERVSTAETDIDNLEKSLAEDGATAQAIKAAKDAADAAQDDVDALEIVVSGKADSSTVSELEGRVSTIEGDYLKGTDKTELEGKITTAQNAADKAQGVVDALEGVVATHTGNATMHITADERTNWNNAKSAIDAFLDENAVSDNVVNTLKEIQEYINGEGEAAEQLLKKISDAQDAADAAQGEVDALEKVVGTGFSETKTVASEISRVESIADAAQTAQEVSDAIDAKISGLTADSHTHSNKALLDTYTQTEADLADAVDKKHGHSNKTELDKFAEGDKAKLDTAVQTVSVADGCEMLSASKAGTTVTLALYYGGDDAE